MAPAKKTKKRSRSTAFKPAPMESVSPLDTTKSWFENSDWSDLTIELSDGQKIPVHKSVLCTRNAYFNALCGLGSRFAESQQKEVQLEDDNPDAVRAVIRKIYGWYIENWGKYPWQHWQNVARAADKYLEPELVSEAAWNIAMYGFDRAGPSGGGRDIEGTCEILDALGEFISNEKVLDTTCRLATKLQHHIPDDETFRSYLLSNPKVTLKMLEDAAEHPRTVHTGLDICDYHLESYFQRTEPGSPCPWCLNDERPTERYNIWHVRCG